MNVYRLGRDIQAMSQISEGLSFEERFKLQLGLKEIEDGSKFDQLLFWGKITGLAGNYYLAVALKFRNEYEFPSKAFFYARDDFIFSPLPPIVRQFQEKCEDFNEMFKGDPEAVLWEAPEEPEGGQKEPEAKPEKTEDDQNISITEDEENILPEMPKKFKEIHRLSFVVRAIEVECATTPVGAVVLLPIHELRWNPNFSAPELKTTLQKSHWMHFREPSDPLKKANIEKDDAIFRRDLLDGIEDDLPRGCWSLQASFSKEWVTLRNYVWAGFLAYLNLEHSTFGYCYIGNGCKNVELALMI